MATFWRLQKQDYFFAAIELKKRIPELEQCDAEYLTSKLRGSNIQFYKTEKRETPLLIRLTLPFAIILFSVLFLLLPIKYVITGRWGYKVEWLQNWLRSLGF
jgi:hypothetical protein